MCVPAEGGKVTWWATGCLRGSGGCVHKVGIIIVSPIEQCLGSVCGWACIHVHIPRDLLLIGLPFHLILLIGHSHHSWHGIGLLSGNLHWWVCHDEWACFLCPLLISSIPRTSFGNGMPLSFGHSHSRHWVFSSICSNVMVMGLHQ